MRLTYVSLLTLFLAIVLGGSNGYARDLIWLSGDPPPQAKQLVRPSGMQHYMAFRVRDKEKLIIWPRIGQTPKESKYLDSFETEPQIFLFSPDGDQLHYDLSKTEKGFALTYDFLIEGYHNIYFVWQEVRNEILFIHVAKSERLSHKCMNGHKNLSKKVRVDYYPELIPFEIIRNRFKPTEDFHLILQSGNQVKFSALLDGIALSGVEFTFVTEKAWTKTVFSDENGMAEFQIPEDYFTNMPELNKDETFHFLLSAKYAVNKSGLFDGKLYNSISYTCTYAGDYEPSPSLYKSSFWAVIVFVFSSLVIGAFLFYYRKRKHKFY